MRRTVLSSIFFTSLTALSVAVGACATAPVDDDLSGLTQEQNPTDATDEESPSSKLPPSSNPSKDDTAKDAGTTQPKDSGTTQPKDSGTTPVDSGTSTGGGDCDPNDPIYALKLLTASNPTPCPCSASECCFLAVCLPK